MTYSILPTTQIRRDFAQSLSRQPGKILEIGAFDNPVFHRDLGDDVLYTDWFSKDELLEIHKNNPGRRLDQIVEVDFPIKQHNWSQEIPERFSLICGSHVIEHIADVIFWLNQLDSLLLEGGIIFLAIPDKQFTFDYYRAPSLATEMIREHLNGLTKPSVWQVAQHFYYKTDINTADLWAENSPRPFKPRFSHDEAIRHAEFHSRQYADVHCWVFTPESFSRLMTLLHGSGFISLKLSRLVPTQYGSNEFWAILTHA